MLRSLSLALCLCENTLWCHFIQTADSSQTGVLFLILVSVPTDDNGPKRLHVFFRALHCCYLVVLFTQHDLSITSSLFYSTSADARWITPSPWPSRGPLHSPRPSSPGQGGASSLPPRGPGQLVASGYWPFCSNGANVSYTGSTQSALTSSADLADLADVMTQLKTTLNLQWKFLT